MMDGILSNAFRKLRAAATGSAIASMQPMSYKDTDTTGEPVEHVTEPDKQIAHSALGDYGPFSVKYATKDFLSYGNKKFRIEMRSLLVTDGSNGNMPEEAGLYKK